MVEFARMPSETETVAQWAKIRTESETRYKQIWEGVPSLPDREDN